MLPGLARKAIHWQWPRASTVENRSLPLHRDDRRPGQDHRQRQRLYGSSPTRGTRRSRRGYGRPGGRRGRLDWPGRRSPPDKSCLPACSDRCLHSLFHSGIRPAPARSLRHACARAWARSSRIQSAAPFWRIPAIPQHSHQPGDDWPETAHVAGGLARVAAVLDRIASDAEDLARARRAGELPTAAVLPGRRAERRRLAEPDLDFGTFCRTGRMPAPRRRRWNEPGMRGRPSGTAAGRPGSSPPAPAAHSTGADDPCQEL